ncbi:GNAT family N-acetyltransferase [Micromonospora chersina]|uniref:GNAT family N-acetyltransferase n=1 Tax=Micromonospora chersina TaxID=47854 RepID=UPI003C86E538
MGGRGSGNEELVTTRLALRRPTLVDVDLIHAIHSDPRACAHNPSDMLSTRAEAEDRYQRWDEHWERWGFRYGVVHADGERLGFCGVKAMALRRRRAGAAELLRKPGDPQRATFLEPSQTLKRN